MTSDKKLAQKKADAKRAGRTRNFATIVYPDSAPENWESILSDLKIGAFVSPLHDKDINADGTPKKPHWHVLFTFDSVKTTEQALLLAQKIGGIGLEKVTSLRGYARYLCHLDNPEKAQYSQSSVKCFGGADFYALISLPTDKYKVLGEIIDFCTENEVVSFAFLLRYARENKEDWFRYLADSGTSVVRAFLKSQYWEKYQQ